MKERILKILKDLHTSSGGHCGITTTRLVQILQVDFKVIVDPLNELHKNNQITLHAGVHDRLLKYNLQNETNKTSSPKT